jgi:hypothetical protein
LCRRHVVLLALSECHSFHPFLITYPGKASPKAATGVGPR